MQHATLKTVGVVGPGNKESGIECAVPGQEGDAAERKRAVAGFRRRRSEWQSAGMSVEDIFLARHLDHRE